MTIKFSDTELVKTDLLVTYCLRQPFIEVCGMLLSPGVTFTFPLSLRQFTESSHRSVEKSFTARAALVVRGSEL